LTLPVDEPKKKNQKAITARTTHLQMAFSLALAVVLCGCEKGDEEWPVQNGVYIA